MVEKKSWGEHVFNILNYVFISLFTLFCFMPVWIMIVASFTDDLTLRRDGYLPWASQWSVDAYRWVLSGNDIRVGYRVTTTVTVVGTLLSLLIMACLAYVLSVRRFKWRMNFSFYVYFTMIFSGGIIPWFITCRMLGLHDNIWALIVPMLINPWWVFVLRNFYSSIPHELVESAYIDGATDAQILYRLVLPLSLPAMATVGLFTSVAYWNDWWHGVILLSFAEFRPLAVIILRMLNNLASLVKAMEYPGATIRIEDIPTETVRMATTALTIGPIVLVYPFVQRYFIRGLMVGAIKG